MLYTLGVKPGSRSPSSARARWGSGRSWPAAWPARRASSPSTSSPRAWKSALELGATDAVDARDGNPVEAIRELTGGGAGFTFNTTRSPRVYDQMVDALAPQGTAGFVGPPDEGWEPDLTAIIHGGHAIMGIVQGGVAADVIVPLLIDLYRQGRFPFDRLIREYAFEDIEAAFRDSEAGRTIKPVLRMTG